MSPAIRNRNHRVRDHEDFDLDTNSKLDGAVGSIPSGTLLHDALLALIGGGDGSIGARHPDLTERELPEQHPATAVEFDDTIALLGEDDVQLALEKIAAASSAGMGFSAVISNVSPGIKFDIQMPFAGAISAARLFADVPGNIVLDLWKDTYDNYMPTVGDSICGSSKPTLSGTDKYQDTTLSGWTRTFNVGDVLRINVDSASVLSRVTLALRFSPDVSSPVVGGITLGRIDRTAQIHAPVVTRVGASDVVLPRIARTAVISTPIVTHAGVTVPTGAVFYMAPGGSDTNPGTVGSPWRTIQKFINTNPAPGSTLYLRDGNYAQNQGGHTGDGAGDLIGTVSDPITIAAYPGEVPVFPNMPGATITFRGNFTSNTIGANYVVLDGIRFTGCSPDDEAVLVGGNAGSLAATAYLVKNITIRNCFFSLAAGLTNRDHTSGLVHGCEFITYEDCEFQGPGVGGLGGDAIVLYSQPAARNVLIQRCIFHDWYWYPIQTWDYASTPTITIEIKHCTFKNNSNFDIDLRYHSTALIQDCVFDGPDTSSTIYDPFNSGSTTRSFNYFNQSLTTSYGLTAGSAAINGAHDGSDAGAVPYP